MVSVTMVLSELRDLKINCRLTSLFALLITLYTPNFSLVTGLKAVENTTVRKKFGSLDSCE